MHKIKYSTYTLEQSIFLNSTFLDNDAELIAIFNSTKDRHQVANLVTVSETGNIQKWVLEN